jgi:phospholipase/carboxylesterase
LIDFNDWTLRIRESTQAPSRLLLLIHGLTGDENSMWVFTRDLPKEYWMIAPRAPHTAEPFGYSWRTVQPGTFAKPTFEQLLPAAEALIRLVDQYQASAGIESSEFDVMGFSQGAAMSSVLAFLYPQRIRKIGILSGFVPSGSVARLLVRGTLPDWPIREIFLRWNNSWSSPPSAASPPPSCRN